MALVVKPFSSKEKGEKPSGKIIKSIAALGSKAPYREYLPVEFAYLPIEALDLIVRVTCDG
jgi:hypothetical protein